MKKPLTIIAFIATWTASAFAIPPLASSASSPPLAAAAPFQREVKLGDGAYALQIAARTFRPANGVGPTISLVGATHIGTAEFYKNLQQYLDRQSLVLCEGVGGAAKMKQPKKMRERDKGGLQNVIASALGLDFQLNDIDYTKPNFQNCDMTVEEMERLLANNATNSATKDDESKKTEQSLNNLIALMRGKSWMSYFLGGAFYLVEHSEKMQEVMKLALVHLLSSFDADNLNISASQKRLMKLIVQGRNQHVMSAVAKILHSENPPKTIAIFYGAAHLPGMEKTLRDADGYVPTGEVWFTAFGADLQKAGFDKAAAQSIDDALVQEIRKRQRKSNDSSSR